MRDGPKTILAWYITNTGNPLTLSPYSNLYAYADSVGIPLANNQLTNLYAYAGNDPVNMVDPYGLWQTTLMGGWGPGAIITFGNNGGQWNFGWYVGAGQGLSVSFNPDDTGCHERGTFWGIEAQGNLGLDADINATADLGQDSGWEIGAGSGTYPPQEFGFGSRGLNHLPKYGGGEATVAGGGETTYF